MFFGHSLLWWLQLPFFVSLSLVVFIGIPLIALDARKYLKVIESFMLLLLLSFVLFLITLYPGFLQK